MLIRVVVSCRFSYSIVAYLYVSCSGLISSVLEATAVQKCTQDLNVTISFSDVAEAINQRW